MSGHTKERAQDQARSHRTVAQGLVAVIAMVSTLIATGSTVGALPAPPNQYIAATVSGGVPSPTTSLAASDCALLIQMTGTIASGLGVYEILDPATATPTRTYSDTEAVQYVVLPGGCSQAVDVNSTYTPPAWDPASGTGGVVFLGGTVLNLAADIDASSAGFASGHSVGAGCDGGDGDWGPDGSMWEGGAGGGGIYGGGGGAGGHVGNLFGWNTDAEFDGAPGGGGTATAGGAGAPNGDGMGVAPSGGSAGCIGNGGSPDQNVVAGAFYTTGAGAGGGGSYGGGGGACSSRSSGAYSAGGGGGGSYAGGGPGGWGGTNTGYVLAEENGEAGNAPVATAVTAADHYFHDADPRVMMGGAGGSSFQGDGSGPYDGGRGGGIVVLAFDSVVGAGGSVLANGGDGSTPPNFSGEGSHGSSGSGGGAGGQIVVTAPAVSGALFSATGGIGGAAVEDTSSNSLKHTGSAGASGGGGGVWFDGVGPATSNTGPNNGATSSDTSLAAPGLVNVDWAVNGGNPPLDSFPSAVTVGGTTYSSTQWAALVGLAVQDSQATNKTIAQSLVDAAGGAFTYTELVAVFPALLQPNNPKNLGLGCGPGVGGTGFATTGLVRQQVPTTTTTTTAAPTTTTTTTAPTTTTTAAPTTTTTTTAAPTTTTTTTAPTTTTTAAPTTTTTAAPTTTPTTTTIPASTTTTTNPNSTVGSNTASNGQNTASQTTAQPPATLAFTGVDSADLTMLAVLLLTLGGGMVVLGRRQEDDDLGITQR